MLAYAFIMREPAPGFLDMNQFTIVMLVTIVCLPACYAGAVPRLRPIAEGFPCAGARMPVFFKSLYSSS